jgi:PAS domain S-box-containing protein
MSQLARVLEERGEELLQRWIESVRQHLAPGGVSRSELEDHIPTFLRQLKATLRGETAEDLTSPEAGTNFVGREHGAQRFRLGFALGALVREYGLLRDLLLELIIEENLQVSMNEVRLLTNFVATAVAEAVEEHARQEERARRAEREAQAVRLSTLFERVPAVVAHVSGPRHVLDLANAACRRLAGVDSVLGHSLRELFPEASYQPFFDLLDRVYATGETQSVREVLLRREPQREELIFDLVYQPTRGADGEVEGVLMSAMEVTSHVRARRTAERLQEEVRRSEAWLSTVLTSIGDAVIVTDSEGRAVFLNPVAEALTGWTREQARSEPLARVFHIINETTHAPVDSPVEMALREGRVVGLANHTLLVRKDGRHVPIDDSAAPVRDAAGGLNGVVLVFRDITHKKQQERELQIFKSLVEASGDYIAFSDADAQMLYMNPAGRRLLGFATLEQARATPLMDLVTPESQATLAREVLPRTLEGQGWRGELFLRHSLTAETIPVTASTFSLEDSRGQVEILATINRDIREHKRQEAERERLLQETERLRAQAEGERARLNTLFLQAPVAIGIIRGTQAVIDVANPLLCRLWGRTPGQVVGKPLLEALPELEGHGFDDLLRGVLATGEAFVTPERAIQLARGEGGALETGYFTFVYEALRDERGHIEGAIIVATEVTEGVLARQQVEALLQHTQESEQARAAVVDALAAQTLIGVCYLRAPELVFETANPIYRQFLGRDVVGMSVRQAHPGPDGQATHERLTRLLQTGEPILGREVPFQLAPEEHGLSSERLFDFTFQPVRAPGGGYDGVLSLSLEVTEQVHARREAQRLAEEERGRRDFEQHLIGIVSHDLRNPLGAILLGLQLLLRREDLDARTVKSLARLHSSTERAVRMVRDLLDFTQARLGGRLKIERVPVNVHEVVRTAVEELHATHSERMLRLETRGEGSGEWDGDRIAQLLGNLVGNALKYSPAESAVTVLCVGGPEDVLLEVHNTGEPIAAEALPRLFQPLQRAVEGIDKASRSVGLGLYIVDQIVRAHAGSIHVNSTALEGTLFSVRLPRRG